MVVQVTENGRRTTNSAFRLPTSYFMPTVLIVENDTDNRLLLKIWLEMWNYRVIEAADGVEALRLAVEHLPDLILMDVKMPLLDGLDAARAIRQSAEIGDVPIIFVSGCAEARYRQAANEAGANGYLVKPFDFDNLLSLIAEQIAVSRPV